MSGPTGVEEPAPASGLDFQPASTEVAQTEKGPAEKKETLSQTSDDLLTPSLGRRPSSSVPWEKEGKGAKETWEDAGLLHEVASLCHMTSAFQQDFNISEETPSGNRAQINN